MIVQTLIPSRSLFFAGENVTFRLSGIPSGVPGRAVVRTNIGSAKIRRQEEIELAETGRTLRGFDWHDLEMPSVNSDTCELVLPLTETGVFEAKCCFIPADGSPILWPAGGNFRIKVTSGTNIAGNGIYCCFVRQFGATVTMAKAPELPDVSEYDDAGFVIIPPSGTFRSVIKHLDHIFDELNCRILQLLPIHPIPTSYGKMGRYGSPFAATDYFAVDPALAEFDTKATPMEQFGELVDAVHRRRGRIFMDIPVNHTGWASKLQNEHPDCFVRKEDGTFVSPGAWGVTWADLCCLDYGKSAVWKVMAKVFLFWCNRGVDGFRCDAGYMLPQKAWNYITARVRSEYPDTVFLLEGLGGPLAIQEKLLGESGLDWGYSELFQNYSRDEITRYYPYMNDAGNRCGTLVNFAETHDNLRLAAQGKKFARLRFSVTALLSQHGSFGFANGAEYFAAEKIDVHGCGGLNYGSPDSLNTLIGKLNLLLGSHPAFGFGIDVKLIQCGGGNVIAAWRSGKTVPPLLILLNLDCDHDADVTFRPTGYPGGIDLLTEENIQFKSGNGNQSFHLAPGEGRCVSFDDFRIPRSAVDGVFLTVLYQRAGAMAKHAAFELYGFDAAARADGVEMLKDPENFIAKLSGINPPPVTIWNYPQDERRIVMVPPGDALLIYDEENFIVDIFDERHCIDRQSSLPGKTGEFALIPLPRNQEEKPKTLTLKLTSFDADGTRHIQGTLLLLPPPEKRSVRLSGSWNEAQNHYVLCSNNLGGYTYLCADWGKKNSKYEAFLAANVNRNYPVDRRVLFSFCRAWLVINEYSQELTGKMLESFAASPANCASWLFAVPDGRGRTTKLAVTVAMALDADAVRLKFHRQLDNEVNASPCKLILRPDLEDRINHQLTRACDGPEHRFRSAVTPLADGFDFQPGETRLSLRVSCGTFHQDPEWRYMIDLPKERYYGLGDKTDLFSPGYFTIQLAPGEECVLTASVGSTTGLHWPQETIPQQARPEDIAIDSLSRFVVNRDGLGTVIAGYPWFLDWGRDTLIVLRGLVRFPEFQKKAAAILQRFAAFEKGGTIPNMIIGGNDSNRDTTDAPLYLIVAVRDYIDATGDTAFIETKCGDRTMREILLSIIRNCTEGTFNGIQVDPASGLVFSPAHFSWMDTNFPAGTPREGYPIEIQALWFAALKFLDMHDEAAKVASSIAKYYFAGEYVSDCLHARRGESAAQAKPDDHTRCNMLTAITLGAVTTPELQNRILREASVLLVPGAIRTLADRKVEYALPVNRDGRLLNDPSRPYRGHYCGPEDTERKVAYHNGTAWCWPFPAYCEALFLSGGEASRQRALALLLSCAHHMESGIIGELPEVLDGDAPHLDGGCLAQAWSASEFFRVLKFLRQEHTR